MQSIIHGFVIPMGQEHKHNAPSTRTYCANTTRIGGQYCEKNPSGSTYETVYLCAYYAIIDKHPLSDEENEFKDKNYWNDFLG